MDKKPPVRLRRPKLWSILLPFVLSTGCFSSEYNFHFPDVPVSVDIPLDTQIDTQGIDSEQKPDIIPPKECSSGSDCDDGNACTAESCKDGVCVLEPTPIPGCCQQDQDCPTNDLCTTSRCEDQACVFTEVPNCCKTNNDCSEGGDCVDIDCIDNKCIATAVGAPCCKFSENNECDDGNPCTEDTCEEGPWHGGMCQFTDTGVCCTDDASCDDGYGCTVNTCNADGQCESTIASGDTCCGNDNDCDDGNPCISYICTDYTCDVETWIPSSECCFNDEECKDTSVCTEDTCTATGCENTFIPGCCFADSNCNDFSACTTDKCINNQCVSTPTGACCEENAECVSDDPCSIGICSDGDCIFTPKVGCCNENSQCSGGPCTLGICVNNTCETQAVEDCCTSVFDCTDGPPCSQASCENNSCVYSPMDDCCSNNAQCNDDNPCTTDICENQSCLSFWNEGCCTDENDCPEADIACKLNTCQNNVCVLIPDPSCLCSGDADCDDGNPCTTDSCSATGSCSNIAIPDCCEDEVVFFDNFDDGSLAPFNANPDSGLVHWQIAQFTHFSPGYSAYFGNPEAQNYNSDGDELDGRLRSPVIDLPADKEGAVLEFWMQPGLAFFDNLTVRVREAAPGSSWEDLWSLQDMVDWDFFNPQWEIFTLPLNAFAGKSVRLQWRVESEGDWFFGQGAAIDDVSVVATCEASSSCTNSSQCNDGDSCTQDICSGGQCVFTEIPSCCANDGECDDSFACTQDTCGDDGQCNYALIDGCCAVDAQCDDGNGCTADSCVSNECVYTPLADCCTSNASCDDSNSCTIDLCVGGKCEYSGTVDPSCCVESVHGQWAFDDSTLQGWSVENNGMEVQWHVSLLRSWTPAFSLRFGNPDNSSFDNGEIVFGSATSPEFIVPLNGTTRAKAMFYLDVEAFDLADQVRLIAVSEGITTELWHKDFDSPLVQWFLVDENLTPWAGKIVQLKLEFDSVDDMINEGEGAFVDSIIVETTCSD